MKKWRLISNDVQQTQNIEISCWYGDFKGAVEVALLCFSDASVSGCSCCTYIQYCYNNCSYNTSLVFSKSRIAPIKTQAISHLELQATLLLVKSIKNIYESLIPTIPINLLCYWNNSAVALFSIKNSSKKYELYIGRCVSEIHELSKSLNWHHVISGSNPADILSRGRLISELSQLYFWLCGPKFFCTKYQFDSIG